MSEANTSGQRLVDQVRSWFGNPPPHGMGGKLAISLADEYDRLHALAERYKQALLDVDLIAEACPMSATTRHRLVKIVQRFDLPVLVNGHYPTCGVGEGTHDGPCDCVTRAARVMR